MTATSDKRGWIVSLAAHISFRRRLTLDQAAAIPTPSPLKGWGSVIGLIVVLAAVGKSWYDFRINLISGVGFLIGLTVLYFILRPGVIQKTS